MSAYRTIRCLRCRLRELRAEIVELGGTPPPACCVILMPGAPPAFAIRRLRCQVKELETIIAEMEAEGDIYLRPGGVFTFLRPDGVSNYIRP